MMTLRDWLTDVADALANLARGVVSLPLALLPRRCWEWFPRLPISDAVIPSGLATLVVGFFMGARGFLAYAVRAADSAQAAVAGAAMRQLQGHGPAGAEVTTLTARVISMLSPFAFMLATPMGWLASYLVISGALRAISAGVGQPFGDPLLTGIDAIVSRCWQRARAGSRRWARERQEGPEVADRLIAGDACGLPATDLVVLAARRKPDWTRGTIVVTPDAWYRLAEPFDVDLPHGLRTAYPLTRLGTTEVLRRSVRYTLPPLQHAPSQLRRR